MRQFGGGESSPSPEAACSDRQPPPATATVSTVGDHPPAIEISRFSLCTENNLSPPLLVSFVGRASGLERKRSSSSRGRGSPRGGGGPRQPPWSLSSPSWETKPRCTHRSSPKTSEHRYANGTSNRLRSAWHGIATVLRNAFSTSADAPLLSKHMAYSMTVASKGSVILPSSLANPNSSCDIRSSAENTAVPRHASGTSNRAPSAVYTAQWPLLVVELLQHSPACSLAAVPQTRRFLPFPSGAILCCHLLARRPTLLALIMAA
ncbi:hypothetical protein U9M48_015069 [Paspalum notatum var. saurae]|uniref:Uncharacterized protein n=1 Tax=Paspalum notatum var. saurae TaxID=547442 RepID=A0AAQ3WLI6_PASNO